MVELTLREVRLENHIRFTYGHLKSVRRERRQILASWGCQHRRASNLRRLARMTCLFMVVAMAGCQSAPVRPPASPASIKTKLMARAASARPVAAHAPAMATAPIVQKHYTLLWDQRDADGFLVPLPYFIGNQMLEFDVEYTNGFPPHWVLYARTNMNSMPLPSDWQQSFWRVGQHFK